MELLVSSRFYKLIGNAVAAPNLLGFPHCKRTWGRFIGPYPSPFLVYNIVSRGIYPLSPAIILRCETIFKKDFTFFAMKLILLNWYVSHYPC